MSYLEKAVGADQASAPHVSRAEAHLAALRKELSQKSARLSRQLTSVITQQRLLSERLMKGKIAPADANERNRDLTLHIQGLRIQLAELESLLHAANSTHLGGFVDLPLDEYAGTGSPQAGSFSAAWRRLLSLRPSRSALAVWLFAFILGVAGAVIFLRLTPVPPSVMLSSVKEEGGRAQITIQNNTPDTVVVGVPWPDAGPLMGTYPVEYGLAVYMEEPDRTGYRLAASSQYEWEYLGLPVQEATTITVYPMQSIILKLDIKSTASKAHGVRVALCSAAGAEITRIGLE